MIPILCVLAILLLAGIVTFCAVIGGYRHPDEWWRDGADAQTLAPFPDAAFSDGQESNVAEPSMPPVVRGNPVTVEG